MKLSHTLLFGVFLLSFQAQAMDTPDCMGDVDDKRQLPNLQKSPLNQGLPPDQNNPKKKRKRKKNPSGAAELPQNTVEVKSQTAPTKPKPGSLVRLPKNTIENMVAEVESYIQHIMQNKIEDPIRVHVLLTHQDIPAFHDAFTVVREKYPFPFSWSIWNKGPSKVESEQPSWVLELTLSSLAKERERVEKQFVYKSSDEDKKTVDWRTIYDVAMRSGFDLEDFKFNNAIKIRILELNGESEAEDLQTFQHFVEDTVAKDENPFHILRITLNKKAKGHYHEMYDVFRRKLSELNAGQYDDDRGVVFDSQEGLLYLCRDNTHRRILNLHGKCLPSGQYEGRSVKQAGLETQTFILQAYEMFQEDVTVLTGRGNHVNATGQRGVLKEAFRDWMEVEPFPSIVKSYCLWGGDGGYKVTFKKIQKLNLNNSNIPDQNPIPIIKETIAQMIEQKKRRLHIILDEQEEPSKGNREFNLLMGLYADLHKNNNEIAKLITPLSFEGTPREMKIIFNKQHSKNPFSFTFGNSFGSTSTLGTIHYWDR